MHTGRALSKAYAGGWANEWRLLYQAGCLGVAAWRHVLYPPPPDLGASVILLRECTYGWVSSQTVDANAEAGI
jgi:hypothetical protein